MKKVHKIKKQTISLLLTVPFVLVQPLQATPTTSNLTTEIVTPMALPVAVGEVIEDNLNFRNNPYLYQSQIMDKIPKGTQLAVFERVNDFYKVMYNHNIGFVYADYLSVEGEDILLPSSEGVKEEVVEQNKVENGINSSNEIFIENLQVQAPLIEEDVSLGMQIVNYALLFVGNPYVYGGNDLYTGVDCSGYTQQVMKAFQIALPRTSKAQSQIGVPILEREALKPGDLLFFGENKESINHVSIYIGDQYMVHASTPKTGIMISKLGEKGFSDLQGMRRVY